MDNPAVAIVIGIIVAAFIVGGLVWAFIADRSRNEDVAHDTERLDPEPAPPTGSPRRSSPDRPEE